MRTPVSQGQFGRMTVRWLVTVAAASMLAACSNSIERFSTAYVNPSDTDPVYTASVPQKKQIIKKRVYQAPAPSADETIIESPVARASLPDAMPSNEYEQSYKKAYKQPTLAAGKSKLKLNQMPPPDEEMALVEETVDEPIAPQPKLAKSYHAPAKKLGTVRVTDGMTMYSIAKANGLTVDQLADANNIREPYTVVSGQILRIPGQTTAEAPAVPFKKKKAEPFTETADVSEETVVPKAKRKSKGTVHTVERGETLYSLGRTYGVSPFAIADANGLTKDDGLRLGQQVRIPGATKVLASADQSPVVDDQPDVAPQPVKKKKAVLALTEEQDQDATEQPVADAEPVAKPKVAEKDQEQIADVPAPASGGMNLRWPVKGKIISGFGPKTNGLKNEGINIAVPEGTSIRAADTGVVAYAGSELKGYGNLVLIRHTGGYVTAYAHAKELLVKRGDTVKRGDIIAKAGQTGAVSSPQLHFEVRKGATALDPVKHLASATASN